MPAGKGTYGNKVGRPRNKRTGEDFLDREQTKKKKSMREWLAEESRSRGGNVDLTKTPYPKKSILGSIGIDPKTGKPKKKKKK